MQISFPVGERGLTAPIHVDDVNISTRVGVAVCRGVNQLFGDFAHIGPIRGVTKILFLVHLKHG